MSEKSPNNGDESITPDRINALLIDDIREKETELRQTFVKLVYGLLLDRLNEDIKAIDEEKRLKTGVLKSYTQLGQLDAYTRETPFKNSISLLSMPAGTVNENEEFDGNERLRVHFPVRDHFMYSSQDIEQLFTTEDIHEVYVEWSFWENDQRTIIRWLISDDQMLRYSTASDASEQFDEIDDFERIFKGLAGKRLSTKGPILMELIERFVNFNIQLLIKELPLSNI